MCPKFKVSIELRPWMVAMATMAKPEGSTAMLVSPMVRWAAAMRRAEARKTGRVENRLRKMAAKRPPGILARETTKFM